MKSPRFAECAIVINYDPDEELVCTMANYKSIDYFDDPSEDKVSSVLCEAKIELNNTDLLPDTQMVRESTLPFPRESLWAIARAIGHARAVYTRFMYLIS